MSSKKLSAIRAIVRQKLRDEFAEGIDQDWKDDELDIYIGECLVEISEVSPYVVKETLKTTASSRELDISSIEDLLNDSKSIEKLEYPTGKSPRAFRNFKVIDASTIEIDTTLTPAADEDVYLYCNKLHQLTESTSTLKSTLESLLVLGATALATIAYAQSIMNTVPMGGSRSPSEMLALGNSQLALYRTRVKRLATARTYEEYPKS